MEAHKMGLSEILVSLRESRGLQAQQVAERVGVSNGYISLIEQGKRQPSREVLKSLARFYGVSIDYLLSEPGSGQVNLADPRLEAIMRGWESITEQDKAMLAEIVKRFVDSVDKEKGDR
jgi:transcriptional regulator with XRE-family HTH domain